MKYLTMNEMIEINGGEGPGTKAWVKRIRIHCGGRKLIKTVGKVVTAASIFVPVIGPAAANTLIADKI